MRWIAPALMFAALVGCSKPTRIVLEPKQPSFRSKGEPVAMIAHVMTSHMENAEAKVTWSVEDPAVASVSETGIVRAVGSGRTKVIAKHQDLVASMPIEVLLVEKVRTDTPKVELSQEKGDPSSPTIIVSTYSDLPLKDRTLDYSVKDPTICRVDRTGQFWPINPGETVVTASVDGHSVDIPCVVTKK